MENKDKVIFDGDPNLKNSGHYKKDSPNQEIGLQKFKKRVTYIIEVEYTGIGKTENQADENIDAHCGIQNIQFEDGYGKDENGATDINQSVEVDTYNINKVEKIDETPLDQYLTKSKIEKVEECIPYEETFYADKEDNRKEHEGKEYDNYDDPNWSKDEYEWKKNKDGTDIK
tara:strand:+ start:430 stop:945 length:516 start_codon:yes stop_codon:yes gene_type:complete